MHDSLHFLLHFAIPGHSAVRDGAEQTLQSMNHLHRNRGRKKEEGRRKKEEGRRKKEEGRRKKEEGRRKKEEGRRKKTKSRK